LLNKILAVTLFVVLFGRLILLPRFARLKAKLDRVINAILLALGLVYGAQLVWLVFR
jgi:hypothetical protein